MTAASVNKRTTETKFVTCFADARPDVDITFRDVLLSRPTDHYLVGIDNFSMTSSGLSMIEPLSGDYEALIRIVKNRAPDAYNPFAVGSDTAAILDAGLQAAGHVLAYMRVTNAGFNFEVKTTEVLLSMQQLLHRLNELAADVNLFMNAGLAAAGANPPFQGEFNYTAAAEETTEHLRFDVRSDGRLEIRGTRAFWGCFSVELPSPQYQFGFLGDRNDDDDNDFRLRRFLSMNPDTGALTFNKIKVTPEKHEETYFQGLAKAIAAARFVVNDPEATGAEQAAAQNAIIVAEAAVDAGRAYNTRTIYGSAPRALTIASVVVDATTFNTHNGAKHREFITYTSHASIFSTLERRVALEVGCSLPIKNSPMIDHQKETPDFVLARWIWRSDGRVETNDRGGSRRYGSLMPACIEYQGPRDRITYHELQAQAKIQTLRIRLFARVRQFSATEEKWTMRVIVMPTNATDWWHARIHFVSKD